MFSWISDFENVWDSSEIYYIKYFARLEMRLLSFCIILILCTEKSLFASINEDLITSAKTGDLNGVKKSLAEGARIETKIGYGITALMAASENGHIEVVKYLVSCGAKIDNNPLSTTSLMRASRNGHLDVVRFLVSKGANVNAKQQLGETALMEACENGHLAVVKYLVSKGADMYIDDLYDSYLCTYRPYMSEAMKGYGGSTALRGAIFGGHLDIVEYLIEQDLRYISPDLVLTAMENNRYDIAQFLISKDASIACNEIYLYYAASSGNFTFFEEFLSFGLKINYVHDDGSTILLAAANAENDDLSILSFLIDNKLDVNAKNKKGETALHIASSNRHIKQVMYLLAKGADVRAKTESGKTALMYAAETGYLDMAKYLIKKGAAINEVTNNGETALSCAINFNHADMAYYLFSQKASCNSGKELIYASRNGFLDLVKKILGRGVDINKTSKNVYGENDTALQNAILTHHYDVMRYLVENGARVNNLSIDCNSMLFHVVKNQKIDELRFLASKGADISVLDSESRSLLFAAAASGNYDIFHFLVSRGLDINKTDKYGDTILMAAAGSTADSGKIMRYLIANKVDIHAKNNDGATAIHFAASNKAIDLLIEAGADINERRNDGSNALSNALSYERVKLYVEHGIRINDVNNNGETALMLLMKNNEFLFDYFGESSKTIEYFFLNGADIHVCNNNSDSLLFYFINEKMIEFIDDFKKQGLDVNHKNKEGKTPLMVAAKSCDIEAVNCLLKNGANINARDNEGLSALFYLINSDSYDSIAIFTLLALLEQGADVNMRDKKGRTPLMYAVTSYQRFDMLLDWGAQYDIVDDEGWTLLMHIASKEYFSNDVAKKILSLNKFNIMAKNKEGHTAEDIAKVSENHRFIKFLESFKRNTH